MQTFRFRAFILIELVVIYQQVWFRSTQSVRAAVSMSLVVYFSRAHCLEQVEELG